ncbi:cysteine desulfurase [Patescibacteria group bacterium]|nr:cysteine desulfurase [Patescibacteria group bacterium]
MTNNKTKKKRVYLDYAATTPVDKAVVKSMLPYFTEKFGNPASIHSAGTEANKALEKAREIFANYLSCDLSEIFFTSSATESNNWALKGIARAYKNKGNKIIVSSVEHDCVLNSAKWLSQNGFEIEYAPVDEFGTVDLEKLKKMITKETILVSIMHSNNEIGTLQPVKEIGEICKEKGVLFHTDAAQSFGKMPINLKKVNIDLLTASSHKIYGPKGVALLYIRKGTLIEPLLHGGGHERGKRSSTSNVAGIVGFAKALELCLKEMQDEKLRQTQLRDKIIKNILKNIPNSHLNGHPKNRLFNNVNMRFDFIEGEALMMELDNKGIEVSTVSACASSTLQFSHVLLACGIEEKYAQGTIRISLGRYTTEKDVDYLLEVLPKAVEKMRKISPLNVENWKM